QRIFFLQLRVAGSTMGTRDELLDLLSFCAQQQIRPHIGLELPLAEAERGFRAMIDGETAGKIVLTQ
ncbi:MAG: Alcohol dehydrogenase zinc-binding domain protein, partial [Frankiales bacterium]|nr:Alcohol dehydrogenase zinc-binding domain protein [Frankiales bacterium]